MAMDSAARSQIAFACLALTACNIERKAEGRDSPSLIAENISDTLASIGGTPVTLQDLRPGIGQELAQLELRYGRARHSIIQAGLDSTLNERVIGAEARRANKSVEELVEAESGGALAPSSAEIAAWYNANLDRTGGRPLAELYDQIGRLLRDEKSRAARERLKNRLYEQHNVSVRLSPFRVPLENAGAPSRGPESAPVTLVEFSDFQCPFCLQFTQTLKEIERIYSGRVRIVYRQFPIESIHPQAVKAAEASLCAADQHKFWELHDTMFADHRNLSVERLKQMAASVGLDKTRFDACLDSGAHGGTVAADLAEGLRVGVNGTPALFVNGIPLQQGALPLEVVREAVDNELKRVNESRQ
jgi:predicted DsbA family dithiol-disulfide isomerase